MTAVTAAPAAVRPDDPAQALRRSCAAVRVQFTWWGTHRSLTAQQRQEVGQACAADARLLTAGKRLVDRRHPALRALTALRGRIGNYWRGLTLPYVEGGVRLIRQADVEPFARRMGGFRAELRQAEADLSAAYGEIKADARRRLGRLYSDADYPGEVRGLFDVCWEFPNVEPPSYLMRVSPELYEEERARVAARFEEAVRLAEEAFAAELADLVDHLAERLSPGPDGRPRVFRDSAVAHFAEFFERFSALNVRSNAELDALVGRAQSLFRGVTAERVRALPEVRRQLRAGMSEVRQRLGELVIDAPRRRIIRPQSSGNGVSHEPGD